MTERWEKEKAYRARRAQMLANDMNQAIEEMDKTAFLDAYYKAKNYMRRPELTAFYHKWLENTAELRRKERAAY